MVTEVPDPAARNVFRLLALDTAERGTVRSYLTELLCALWLYEADAKYGVTGESDWRYDIYEPMQRAGLIPAWRDGYGVGYRIDDSRHPEDRQHADALICAAIRHMTGEPR